MMATCMVSPMYNVPELGECAEHSESDNSIDNETVVDVVVEDRARSGSTASTLSGKLEALNTHTNERIGNYIVGKTLGEGAFAKVKSATHAITGTHVAMKIINKTKIKDPYVLRNLHREADLMRRLRHRHVIRLYEIIETERLFCLVTESADGGEVGARSSNNGHIFKPY